MINSFVCRIVTTSVGFVWPAYKCYKDIDKQQNAKLRSWCTYWVTLAIYTASERFLDNFLFWIPLYNECKIAFVFFLARFHGADYMYDVFVQPRLHENEQWIDDTANWIREWIHGHIQKNFQSVTQYLQHHMFKLLNVAAQMQHRHGVTDSNSGEQHPAR